MVREILFPSVCLRSFRNRIFLYREFYIVSEYTRISINYSMRKQCVISFSFRRIIKTSGHCKINWCSRNLIINSIEHILIKFHFDLFVFKNLSSFNRTMILHSKLRVVNKGVEKILYYNYEELSKVLYMEFHFQS